MKQPSKSYYIRLAKIRQAVIKQQKEKKKP